MSFHCSRSLFEVMNGFEMLRCGRCFRLSVSPCFTTGFSRNQCRYHSFRVWSASVNFFTHSLPKMPWIGYAIVGVSLSFRIFLLKWIWTSIPWKLQSLLTTSLKARLHRRPSCSSRKFCVAWPRDGKGWGQTLMQTDRKNVS